jgi:hypothetical protein
MFKRVISFQIQIKQKNNTNLTINYKHQSLTLKKNCNNNKHVHFSNATYMKTFSTRLKYLLKIKFILVYVYLINDIIRLIIYLLKNL